MTRRNSFLNEIKEDHSAEFNDDLAQEFQDSDDEDGSLSLGAVVNDDELLNMLATRDPEASRASLLEDETAHDEEEGDNSSSKKDKSITDKIRKRTRLARQVTLVFFLSLGLGALLGSFFITRHEDCKDKREEVSLYWASFGYNHACRSFSLTNIRLFISCCCSIPAVYASK